LYRDGEKVKETTRLFEEPKLHLQQLYNTGKRRWS